MNAWWSWWSLLLASLASPRGLARVFLGFVVGLGLVWLATYMRVEVMRRRPCSYWADKTLGEVPVRCLDELAPIHCTLPKE